MNPLETELQEAFYHFWHTYASRKQGVATIHELKTLFADNVSAIGTGEHEMAQNRADVISNFQDDLSEIDNAVGLELSNLQAKLLAPTAGLVEAVAVMTFHAGDNPAVTFRLRISTTFVNKNGNWLVAHNHISAPFQDQVEGEAFPIDALVAKNKHLEKQIDERTRALKERTQQLREEKHKTEQLLYNILPREVAIELKEKGKTEAKNYDVVSVLFTDFKEFTYHSQHLSAAELVAEINICFEAFDKICDKYKIEKIKTIGDSYMVAGGLPVPFPTSAVYTVRAALEMIAFVNDRHNMREAEGKVGFEMRVGIHSGPVVAGIVGIKKFQYDLWGDTVNTASRMEGKSVTGKVNISENTYQLIKSQPEFTFESRGMIEVKGKGRISMYFVDSDQTSIEYLKSSSAKESRY